MLQHDEYFKLPAAVHHNRAPVLSIHGVCVYLKRKLVFQVAVVIFTVFI